MSLTDADPPGRRFRYRAQAADGRKVSETLQAENEAAALRRLSANGLIVTSLEETGEASRASRSRDLRLSERVLLLRQLALMLEAGVPLVEALRTIADGVQASKGRAQLEAVIAALKSGALLGPALESAAPGFPAYVYALVRLGEASGRTADTLQAASDQMAYEDRLRRDLLNALTYPAFLAASGGAAVVFIFVEIVPRFDAMLTQSRARIPALSRAVLSAGTFVDNHGVLAAMVVLGIGLGIGLAGTSAAVRRNLYSLAHQMPVVGSVITAREVALWGRLTAFALEHGVGLLTALALSRGGAPQGPFAEALRLVEGDLKGGAALHTALARRTALTGMDISLLRTGERSGSLPRMFAVLADSYDSRLKDQVKRATALAEPLAIGAISIFVGVIVLSLVMALASLYDAVG